MKILSYLALSLLLILSNSLGNSAPSSAQKDPKGPTGILEKMIVAQGDVAIDLDLVRLNGTASAAQEPKLDRLRFQISTNSFFTILVFDHELRGPKPGSMGLICENPGVLPQALRTSSSQLIIEKIPSSEPFDLVIRDGKTGFIFFNVAGHRYEYDAAARLLNIKDGKLLISEGFANKLRRPSDAGLVVGGISIAATMYPIEITTVVNGAVESSILPPRSERAPNAPEVVPGPDVIVGDLPSMAQFGSNGTQVGLGVGTTSCNNGDQPLNWFELPQTDHPVIPQNLYRMSPGGGDFEQIGQSWLKHAFFAEEGDECGFGCNTSGCSTGSQLCVGCSDPYDAFLNAIQNGLGSRAWVNPFTGVFPSNSNDHTGHTHTGTTHRILVESSDLTAGGTYFAEAQYVTPHEYAWCQTHPGQCNMYNNVSYRQFAVSGTTNFTFTPVGSTVRMTPAIFAWTGATINMIEPAPGVDGRAFIASKAMFIGDSYDYEYAIYNENLDRGIQSFSLPVCGTFVAGLGFHAPLNHPGIANDGTLGSAGFSNAPWSSSQTDTVTWSCETFAQNQNANAIRWGTLYNFRFQTNAPPSVTNATIGFFKTGTPITVAVVGPSPFPCPATPTPTPSPTASPIATPTGTPFPPNGRIAFATDRDNNFQIYTMEPDGNDQVRLTNNTATDLDPAWSPDGTKIAFDSNRDGNIEVYVMNADGSNQTNLTNNSASDLHPDWSPDGTKIVFTSTRDGNSEIYVMDANGANPVRLTNNSFHDINPAWSPDGTKIAFQSDRKAGDFDIYLMDANGANQTNLTHFGADDANPAWSPDGKRIAFQSDRTGNYEIYFTDTAGSFPVQLTNNSADDTSPSWSPDGTKIVFASNRNGSLDIFVMNGDGSNQMQITQNTANELAPDWGRQPSGAPSPTATATATATPTASPSPIPARALNLSTRMLVKTGEEVGIGGFIITGSGTKQVLLRGIGPSLGQVGVPDALADPVMELHGPAGFTTIINNNWRDTQEAEIKATGLAPTDNLESAILVTLPPGAYTAIVEGNDNGTGVGLVEVYDLGPATSQLANISTRAFVGTGDKVLIGGFILGEGQDTNILLRGLGPSLAASGIINYLVDPTFELHDINGSLLAFSDDGGQACSLPPPDPREPCLEMPLPPGPFTVILAGKNGGTGVGLIEIYNLQ